MRRIVQNALNVVTSEKEEILERVIRLEKALLLLIDNKKKEAKQQILNEPKELVDEVKEIIKDTLSE